MARGTIVPSHSHVAGWVAFPCPQGSVSACLSWEQVFFVELQSGFWFEVLAFVGAICSGQKELYSVAGCLFSLSGLSGNKGTILHDETCESTLVSQLSLESRWHRPQHDFAYCKSLDTCSSLLREPSSNSVDKRGHRLRSKWPAELRELHTRTSTPVTSRSHVNGSLNHFALD